MSDRIKEIRARHQAATWRLYELKSQIHDDREMLLAEVDRLTRERDEARADVKRLRVALRVSACSCLSIRECTSVYPQDHDCPHFVARKALEAKP